MTRSDQIPTVGRRVWFWRTAHGPAGTKVIDPMQAFDAGVILVNDDGTIAVAGTDHQGMPFYADSVELRDFENDVHDVNAARQPHATWPQLLRATEHTSKG